MHSSNKIIKHFVGIGPGRSGSTFLFEVLKTHPEIQMAKDTKEINFFNSNYNKGMCWYWRFYDENIPGIKARGEISNTYIYSSSVAIRIKKEIPGARIFSILRDPLERIQSVILFRQRTGQIPITLGMDDALNKYPDIIHSNHYGRLLTPFFDNFSKNQLYIGDYSELKQNTQKFLQDIFTFLGVDPKFSPSIMHKKINPTSFPRIHGFSKIIRNGADFLRQNEFYSALSILKRSKILNSLLYKQQTDSIVPKLSENAKNSVIKELLPDIKILEKKCNRDFSNWYKKYL